MLNLFAATGHIHYAKSARIHLQQMLDLKNTHPWLYQKFSNEGLFVVRRSERFWAGLWNEEMGPIKMKLGGTRGESSFERDIGDIAMSCDNIRKYLLVVHAFGGCDTTSAIFGFG